MSRSRSAIEGEISSLRGAIQSVQARSDLSVRVLEPGRPFQRQNSSRRPRRTFRTTRKYHPMYLEQGALRSSVAEGTLKRGDFPFEGGASSTDSAYIGWLKADSITNRTM